MRSDGGLRALLAFSAGCLIAPWLPQLPHPALLLAVAALAGVALAFQRLLLPALALFGMLWFLVHAHVQLSHQWPAGRAGERVTVTGRIVDLPQPGGRSMRFVLEVDSDRQQQLPRRVQVSWFWPSEHLQPGSRWQMELALFPPSGRHNPDGFDYQRWLLAHRIDAVGRVRGQPELLEDTGLRRWADRQRQHLSAVMLSESVRLDAAALRRALGVADRSGIEPELADLLRQTGTAHLLAISGLHVGMVAVLVGGLAGWLASPLALIFRRLDRRRLAIFAGLAAAFVYSGLAGFTVPTQRALVMLAVVAAAFLLRRTIAPGHALALALVAVLLLQPFAPLSSGFWLSFGAVAVLVWCMAWRTRGEGWLSGLVRAQLVIMIGLLPLGAGLFGQWVPSALPANLLAIPLVGFIILPALLLDMLTILLGLPASGAGVVADFGIGLMLSGLAWLHGFEAAFVPVVPGPTWSLLPASVGAVWLLGPPGWPARWLGGLLMLPLLFPVPDRAAADSLEVHFLDVGSGLAVLLATEQSAVLYDAGPGDGEGADLLGRLLPTLLSRSGTRLERAIISHQQRGHAGGLGSIPDGVPVHSPLGTTGHFCQAGQQWQHGRYEFRILHPSSGLPDLGANSSCVLRVSGPGGSVLLSGGIDSAVEARLLLEGDGLPVDVLQLAAGGHRKASSPEFLRAANAELAIISTARFEPWGRPHPEPLAALKRAGTPWMSTGECGAIRLRMNPHDGLEISTALGRSSRFWHQSLDCP